ncbi:MAG: peptidase C15 [Microcoleaceae cyanobacterium MO_207.B10]|nr:peptidase C15 [Microcoleaceae cyanobacterium MO_207.B10]
MKNQILLTSFDIWKPEHISNSSDDLLKKISTEELTDYSLTFIRKLPVDSQVAPQIVIAKINEIQPDIIICCGMAEKREKLTVEFQATYENTVVQTSVDLAELIEGLEITEISNDAGKFVCEGLYFAVLKYLKDAGFKNKCIFVHVPVLTEVNSVKVVEDFLKIMSKISRFTK